MPAPVTHHDFNDLCMKFKTGQPGLLPPSLHVHLFTNNITPDCHALVAGFVECSDPGYAVLLLVPGEWAFSDFPAPGACGRQAQSNTHTFAFTVGGFTVYGMWVFDTANGVIAWTQRFDAPFLFPAGPGMMTIQLNDVQQQCP